MPVETAGTILTMMIVRRSLLLAALLVALPLAAEDTAQLLTRVWPAERAELDELGRGVGVIFTPDLSVEGNCRFYAALGFACFEGADWLRIIASVHSHNAENPDAAIHTVVLETHGTNGNGLKLQDGKDPRDARSYIAVAALEEMLAPAGIRTVVLSACNSGRLLRPQIYRRLDRSTGDRLFLPATRGIIDASETFDPDRSEVTVVTPGASQIETTLVGSLRELSPATRRALEDAARERGIELPRRFAISEMLIRMLTRDPELDLRTGAYVEELSPAQSSAEASERIFRRFVAFLDALASNDAAAGAVVAAR